MNDYILISIIALFVFIFITIILHILWNVLVFEVVTDTEHFRDII